jgi:hypothetical protein
MLYANARSVRNKLNDFEILEKKHKPDILILCETWLYSSEVQYYNIPGYCGIFNCRDSNTRGGGTAIYIKDDIQYSVLYKNNKCNMLIVEVVICENIRQKICTFYRSPNLDPLDEFFNSFDEFLSKYKGMIVVGDANIDLLEKNNTTFKYKTTISTNNFRIINKLDVDHATRITDSSSTLIDHVLDNKTNNKHEIELIDWPGFDHKLIKICITNTPKKKQCMYSKEFKKINQNILKQYVSDNIEIVENNGNLCNLIDVVKKAKETATFTVKNRIRINNDWLTPNILRLIEKRSKLYKIYKGKDSTELDKIKYKKCKNAVTSEVKKSKKMYIENKINKSNGDSGKIWKVINSVIHNANTGKNKDRIEVLNTADGTSSDPVKIANIMNVYFQSIGRKLYDKIVNDGGDVNVSNDEPVDSAPMNSLFISPTNVGEMTNIIKALKLTYSAGLDGITSMDLKILVEIIAKELTISINNIIFEKGEFPQCLKTALITPVHKNGPRNECGNYRPISILSSFSKVIEKLLYIRMVKFIEGNSGFDKYQYGFQKGSGTTSAMVDALDHINNELDKGNYVVAISIDLSKAFDTVEHKNLMVSLQRIGIRGNACKLIESYLCDRTAITKNGDKMSQTCKVDIGVPQGSILGPLLYLLYIDDMKYQNLKGKYFIYADDTLLLYSGRNIEELETEINNDLKIYVTWLKKKFLTINENKTNYIVFKQKNKMNVQLDLYVNSTAINRTDNIKYLGLVIDEGLSWNLHVEGKINKISPLVGVMRRSEVFERKVKHIVYHTFIMPHVSYGLLVWSQCAAQVRSAMQRVMNKALKHIHGLKRNTSTVELYQMTNELNLEQKIILEKAKYIHKIINGETKTNIKLQLNKDIHSYGTRAASQLRNANPRTNRNRDGFLYSAIDIHNRVPDDIKRLTNGKCFGKQMKRVLLTNEF